MRLAKLLPSTAVVAVGAILLTASPATAVPVTSYEMPFPCGQSWTGTTRASHSPSSSSIDWNRPDDVGDPVVAAAAGVVTTAVPNGTRGYGRYVVVDHGNGESTLYAHLQTVAVGVGQTVDQGSMLGLLGDTGNATGPHLHFEERLNGKTVTPYLHGTKFAFGSVQQSQNCPDVPLAGNFVGDGIAELAVFDRATSTFQISQPNGPIVVGFGEGTDQPIVGDWDGDGFVNFGIRRASERTFHLGFPTGIVTVVMGNRSDLPVAGDWDGNGTWDVGVRKASSNVFRLRKPDGKSVPVRLGKAGDIPVSGDWNGDGVTDLGVWHPSTAQFFQRIAASPTARIARSVTRAYGTARR